MRLLFLHIFIITSTDTGEIRRKNTIFLHGGYFKTFYSCKEYLSTTVTDYTINVTLDSDVEFNDNSNTVIHDSGTFWYFLKNKLWAFPPETCISFSLKYKGSMPTGNCTWNLGIEVNTEATDTTSSFMMTTFNTSEGTTNQPINSSTATPIVSTSGSTIPTATTTPSNGTCLCACPCQSNSKQNMEELLQSIIFELTIAKNSTYISKQKLISASDQRWLSRGIGFVGILVMSLVFGSIVVGDLKRFAEHARSTLRRIKVRRFF